MKVLITGATGGIGKALVEVYYKNGWEIVAVGRNITILNQLKEKYKDRIDIYQVEMTNRDDINKLLDELKNKDIDLVINGAGLGEIGNFENIPFEAEEKMIEINIIALAKITKYFYQKFKKIGKGGIINISSTAGFQCGGPLMIGYYAAKSYVNSLTFGLIGENENSKIRIMLLCPGPTATNFKGMKEEIKGMEKLYITTPMKVAETCYRDFEKGREVSIPGVINKFFYYFGKLLPWKIKLISIKKIQKKK